jgi:hypothetical protein
VREDKNRKTVRKLVGSGKVWINVREECWVIGGSEVLNFATAAARPALVGA